MALFAVLANLLCVAAVNQSLSVCMLWPSEMHVQASGSQQAGFKCPYMHLSCNVQPVNLWLSDL